MEPLGLILGLPLAPLPRQALPAQGCAAFLFTGGQARTLVGMASAAPGTLRIALDGQVADYARQSQTGSAGFGFATTTVYQAGNVTATLELAVQTRRDLSQGAVVDSGTLRIDRTGQDTVILPVAGLIGCAA